MVVKIFYVICINVITIIVFSSIPNVLKTGGSLNDVSKTNGWKHSEPPSILTSSSKSNQNISAVPTTNANAINSIVTIVTEQQLNEDSGSVENQVVVSAENV